MKNQYWKNSFILKSTTLNTGSLKPLKFKKYLQTNDSNDSGTVLVCSTENLIADAKLVPCHMPMNADRTDRDKQDTMVIYLGKDVIILLLYGISEW